MSHLPVLKIVEQNCEGHVTGAYSLVDQVYICFCHPGGGQKTCHVHIAHPFWVLVLKHFCLRSPVKPQRICRQPQLEAACCRCSSVTETNQMRSSVPLGQRTWAFVLRPRQRLRRRRPTARIAVKLWVISILKFFHFLHFISV